MGRSWHSRKDSVLEAEHLGTINSSLLDGTTLGKSVKCSFMLQNTIICSPLLKALYVSQFMEKNFSLLLKCSWVLGLDF